MTHRNDASDALLVALQKGLPLERRPFARLGEAAGLGEDAVLARVRDLFESGVARRFGAVFDSYSLGYRSTLCAADVAPERMDAASAVFADHPGVTHAYERDGRPNLWFTLTAPADDLPREFDRLAARLAPAPVLNLPALRKFKIEAVFGAGEAADAATPAPKNGGGDGGGEVVPPLTERERAVVRVLQGSLPVSEDPFGAAAGELGMDPDALLELLRRWQQAGIVRRIGLILRHRRLGFAANSMCVWPVSADGIEAAGRSCARSPHVTHCYERPSTPAFPYNLYAMIHARTRDEAENIFRGLGEAAGITGGRMLWSVREFKKASPVFFEDVGRPSPKASPRPPPASVAGGETPPASAVLIAAPGTSCPQAQAALDAIGASVARRFPGLPVRWAFTSGGVRRKLAVQGRPAADPAEALAALRADGVRRVAVLPLHLVDGMEFGELAETVAAAARGPGAFERIAIGTPLLANPDRFDRVLRAFLDALPPRAPDEAAVLVAHGSRDPRGAATFAAAAARCRELDARCFLGVILGKPGKDEGVAACRAAGVRKVWLAPFTVAAGSGTRDDVAGPGPDSWRAALEGAGLACEPRMTGLGEIPGVIELWIGELAGLLRETAS